MKCLKCKHYNYLHDICLSDEIDRARQVDTAIIHDYVLNDPIEIRTVTIVVNINNEKTSMHGVIIMPN